MKNINQISNTCFSIDYCNIVYKPFLKLLGFIVIISSFILLALVIYVLNHTISIHTLGPIIVFAIVVLIGGYIYLTFSKNKLFFQKINGFLMIEARPFKGLAKKKIKIDEIESIYTTKMQPTHNTPNFHQTKDIEESKLVVTLNNNEYVEILKTCNKSLIDELQNNLNKILKKSQQNEPPDQKPAPRISGRCS